jgi:fatty-acid peroxygenase
VLLDLWGHNHDEQLWGDPYTFRPERFLGHDIGAFELVPQGAGDPATNHRCPGEPWTVAILRTLAVVLGLRGTGAGPDHLVASGSRAIPRQTLRASTPWRWR